MKKIFLILIATLAAQAAHADSIGKHPRVAELEDSLREQASLYLKARFPDQPFLVNVSVDPVRRVTGKLNDDKGEELPYFDSAENELTDEWDDPNVNLHQLLLRTKKVVVETYVSENVSDGERAEVKDALYQSLHLVEARDEVKVETRKWNTTRVYTYYAVAALAAMLFFLIGFSIIQRSGYKRLAQTLGNFQATAPANASVQSGGGNSIAAPTNDSGMGRETTVKGGLEFSDPVKAREMMARQVEVVKTLKCFPTLDMMIQLDRYGKNDAHALGALLHELPPAMQKKVFANGAESYWLQAMLEPSTFGMEQLNLFQRLVRDASAVENAHVNEMLIHVWRVGADLESFIRTLNRDTALSILSLFPKHIAIRVARKAFPGAWADLLDSNYKALEFTPEHAKEVTNRALKIRPLMDLSKLSQYKNETEIMEYLKVATPEEEREIYLASKSDALFQKTRPPFYLVMEGTEPQLKEFVGRFNPQQWTLALFNLARSERSKIQDQMPEKQRFLFLERLKQFEQQHPDPIQVGQIRELIARRFHEYYGEKSEMTKPAVSENEDHIADSNSNQKGEKNVA
jgi:hypothetical protein